ncbi:MAG TPA: circadian clock protein KaiC [Candidatus Sulfotelmatobacter sp.]|nr:circadian clock protein KaiC [Candidatus Sulfotelmatobacter sp.]
MLIEKQIEAEAEFLPKSMTGVQGFDQITNGGLPKGRITLLVGGPGTGKTLLAMQFLVNGIRMYNEPGVFVAFEETKKKLSQNTASLGFKVNDLIEQKKLRIDYIYIERREIEETGEYDLQGLFVRLGHAIDSIGAKRVVLDTLEAIFSGFSNEAILRAELRRLFRWLEEKGVTAIVTAERGPETLTRYGLEEYVSDCVIVLDHRINEQVSTRRLRVVKYRGSPHGTNEYPYLIDEQGISILPITSIGLDYRSSTDRISTGIPRLDKMLGEKGYYRGTSILISGTAGTGKSSLALVFANSTCQNGEKCLYITFEEAPDQVIRNMRSIGMDLQPWIDRGLLKMSAARSTYYGLETHLVTIHKMVESFNPSVIILDPITNLITVGTQADVKSMLTRLIDYLKAKGITALFTNLTHLGSSLEATETEISSLMDTWILLRDIEIGGERNRGLYILKSRGMAHSNQIREFLLSNNGINLLDVYIGPGGVLTGSARAAQEAEEKANAVLRRDEIDAMERDLERKRKLAKSQIESLQAGLEAEEIEIKKKINEAKLKQKVVAEERVEMSKMRKADEKSPKQ